MVASLAGDLPGLDREGAAEPLLSLVAIARVDGCLPHLAALIAPRSTPGDRRAAVVAQARSLA